MIESAIWWLFFNLLSIVFLAFYSMTEMACVTLNKVRLHYYVRQGNTRAKWLHFLLRHPFRLFGTTLIGVNVAMVAGSECARQFNQAIGLSPDLAPLSQVILVVIFGELAPMFAARYYAEHVAMLGVPLLYASARLLTPVLWVVGAVSQLANFFTKGKRVHPEIFLSQEELRTILEEHAEEIPRTDLQDFNFITKNIFRLRHREAKETLISLRNTPTLPSNSTVAQMKNLVKKTNADFVVIYHKKENNVVGIAFPRDVIRASETRRVRDYARPPWFVTETTKLSQILQQFQRNNQTVAVILNKQGKAKGLIVLDDLLGEIFGETPYKRKIEKSLFIIERTLPGDMLVRDFNRQFQVRLDSHEEWTLSQLMEEKLGHSPEAGDSIFIEPLEITAKETSLLEVKSVIVKSRLK
ncbi:MAG: hemolysin family protein [Waddliaceae bacterium]